MKRTYIITLITSLLTLFSACLINRALNIQKEPIQIGIIYESDASTAYASNFIDDEEAIKEKYGDQVQIYSQYNVSDAEPVINEFINKGCDLIFANSYGYGNTMKKYAGKYPDIQFCQATCSNANEKPYYENYHTFMGEIYQGRYISGVVAGMKLEELIDEQKIKKEDSKIGYVAAFPSPEVISGYTSFFLGVRSVVPEATMTVSYTNSWSSYFAEKKIAKQLINDNCIIISQHSDTCGPAVACEESRISKEVYHVGYNQNMDNVAPTSHLISSTINWEPYIVSAVGAVLNKKKIENVVPGNVHGFGNDISASFQYNWVEMLPVNKVTVAKGTEERITQLIKQFNKNEIEVFKGDYIGVNSKNPSDTYDLKNGYTENKDSSAPTFSYILKDVITIKEY